MPEKSRPSAIPRPFASRSTPPSAKLIKRNAPIPLRGTRKPSTAEDTYTPIPPRSRIPSANIPVMHSPASRNNSRSSSSSVYSQSSKSFSPTGAGKVAEPGENMENVLEIEEKADTASQPDLITLSPESSRMALLRAGSAKDLDGIRMKTGIPRSNTGRMVVDTKGRRTSGTMHPDQMIKTSPRGMPGLQDSPNTPRIGALRKLEGLDGIPETRWERTNTLRSVKTVDIWPTSSSAMPAALTTPQHPKTGPDAVLQKLETLLSPALVAEMIDLPRILCAHDACPAPSASSSASSVFGVPICTAARYASCATVLGAQTHMLPIVVFAAVEELYRIGLTSPRLLRPAGTSKSNGTALPLLVATFDTKPNYGDGLDLSRTRIPTSSDDVSALLLTYLDCLPGPILVQSLIPALLRFCIHAPTPNVAAAQLLLQLLPAPHFSLLVYLLAFLAQVPLHRSTNLWSVKDVARGFARVVCGACEQGEGEEVLEWLLRHWDALSAGLFPRAMVSPAEEGDDLTARITELERQYAAAVRAAYEEGAVAERRMWAREVQALREAWEQESKVVNDIVRRFAEGAPR